MMFNSYARPWLGIAAVAAMVLVGCADQQPASKPALTRFEQGPFCEVTRTCEVRSGAESGKLPNGLYIFRLCEQTRRRLQGMDAVVSSVQTTYDPSQDDKNVAAVSREDGRARWMVDIPRRRYHIKLLGAQTRVGSYFEGACDETDCVVVRSYKGHERERIRYGATVDFRSRGQLQTAVIQGDFTFYWLEMLVLHRLGPLMPSPIGENWFALWHNAVPPPEQVAELTTEGQDILPQIGECYVVSVRFKDPEYRNAELWLWFSPEHDYACVRSVIVVKDSGTVLVTDIREFLQTGTIPVPVSVIRRVYTAMEHGPNPLRKARLRQTLTVETSLSQVVVNPVWKPDSFRFEMPAGTLVLDERHGRTYVYGSPPSSYRFPSVGLSASAAALFAFYLLKRLRRALSQVRPPRSGA